MKEIIELIKDFIRENGLNEFSATVKCKADKETGAEIFDVVITTKVTE